MYCTYKFPHNVAQDFRVVVEQHDCCRYAKKGHRLGKRYIVLVVVSRISNFVIIIIHHFIKVVIDFFQSRFQPFCKPSEFKKLWVLGHVTAYPIVKPEYNTTQDIDDAAQKNRTESCTVLDFRNTITHCHLVQQFT